MIIKKKCKECENYFIKPHHIDFNKKNNNPNNLISLCRSCHGQTNFNRDNWINYFQEKIQRQIKSLA